MLPVMTYRRVLVNVMCARVVLALGPKGLLVRLRLLHTVASLAENAPVEEIDRHGVHQEETAH
jgi:hypothetical protein